MLPERISIQGETALTTDKPDYAPEATVQVSSTDFAPGLSYDIPVIRPDGTIVRGDGTFTPGWDTVAAALDGTFSYSYQLDGVLGTYEVRAYLSPWNGDLTLPPLASVTF